MNRHQKLAIVIAPFLGIGGYVAADYYMIAQEREAAAQPKLYQLEAQGDCNLHTVSCVLRQDDLSLTLYIDTQTQVNQLKLKANKDLQGVKVAFGQEKETQPISLTPVDHARTWVYQLKTSPKAPVTMQVVAKQGERLYLAEFSLTP